MTDILTFGIELQRLQVIPKPQFEQQHSETDLITLMQAQPASQQYWMDFIEWNDHELPIAIGYSWFILKN